MKLMINNIGMIEEANLNLSNLTIIAGENDTGKSTIGKILYSLIKGINNSPVVFEEYRQRELRDLFNQMKRISYNYFLENYEKKEEIYFEKIKISNAQTKNNIFNFLENEYEKELKMNIEERQNELFCTKELFVDEEDTFLFWEFKFNTSNVAVLQNIKSNLNKITILNQKIDKIFQKFETLFLIDVNSKEVQKWGLVEKLETEFENQIQSFVGENNESKIKLYYGSQKIVDMIIENEKTIFPSPLGEILTKDATYIESPYIFSLMGKNRRFLSSKIKNHIEDLAEKLDNLKKINSRIDSFYENSNNIKNINKLINQNINGEIGYDDDNSEYILERNKNKIKLLNVASGIKAFGLLSLLLRTGILKEQHVLILDEPEVHLHPKWQIEYAKLVVMLTKIFDIKILITSHSPFFIEAIQKYCEKESMIDGVNFYLSEKQLNGKTKIKLVNDNIESIYNKLAEAYDKLDQDTLGDL